MRKLAVHYLTEPIRRFFYWAKRFRLPRRRAARPPRPNFQPILVGMESRDLPGETVTGMVVAALALPLTSHVAGQYPPENFGDFTTDTARYGDPASAEQIRALDDAFMALPAAQPDIAVHDRTDFWPVSANLSGYDLGSLEDFSSSPFDMGSPASQGARSGSGLGTQASPAVDPGSASGGGGQLNTAGGAGGANPTPAAGSLPASGSTPSAGALQSAFADSAKQATSSAASGPSGTSAATESSPASESSSSSATSADSPTSSASPAATSSPSRTNAAPLGALSGLSSPTPTSGISGTPAGSVSFTEGHSDGWVLATFSDLRHPSSTSATINWGDGSSTAGTITSNVGGTVFQVHGSHTYTDEGSYSITVAFTDNYGSAQVSDTAVVADASLTLAATDASGLAGAAFTVQLGSLTDANPLATTADFTTTIHWGDGTTSPGTVVDTGTPGQFTVWGSHSYDHAGLHAADFTVLDDGGQNASATSTITISPTSVPDDGGGVIMAASGPGSPVLLNEIVFNPPGSSGANQFVEIAGPANQSLGGYYFVIFDSGAPTNAGVASRVVDLSSYSLGDNGLLMIERTSSQVVSQSTHTTIVTVSAGGTWIGTGAETSALISGNTVPTQNHDYDPTNNGTLTLAGTDALIDALGWGGPGTKIYNIPGNSNSDNILLPSNVLPWAATRLPTDSTSAAATAWYYGKLSGNADTTQYDPSHSSSNFPTGGILTPGAGNAPGAGRISGDVVSGFTMTEGEPGGGFLGSFVNSNGDTIGGHYHVTWSAVVGLSSVSVVRSQNPAAAFDLSLYATPSEEGTYVLPVTISDIADNDDPLTLYPTITVVDAPLHASGSAQTLTGTAGTSISGVWGKFSDDDSGGVTTDYSASIAWGDGTSTTSAPISASSGTFSVSTGHNYSSPGSYDGTITVLDHGAEVILPFHSTVRTSGALNALPGSPTFTEGNGGSPVTLATFKDTDSNTNSALYSVSLTWGDGSTGGTGGAGLSLAYSSLSGEFSILGSHSYAEESGRTLSLTLTDSDGASTNFAVKATVADAALSGSLASLAPTEGLSYTGTIATFSDADPAGVTSDYSATIDWGDGTSLVAGTIAASGGSFAVSYSGSHSYAEEGTYLVSVIVNDSGGAAVTLTDVIAVSDASLSPGTGTTLSGLIGTTLSGSLATFTDSDPGGAVSDYQAWIDFGDGSAWVPGTVAATSTGFAVSGGHGYAAAGNYSGDVYIYDGGGSQTSVGFTSSVSLGSSNLSITLSSLGLSEGQSSGGSVIATFSDSDANTNAALYSATVFWGDGTSTSGTVSSISGHFQVVDSTSHSYADEGSYTLAVKISDSDADSAAAVTSLTVADAALSGTGNSVSAKTNQLYSGTLATLTDAYVSATAGDFVVQLDWGDGSPPEAGALTALGSGLFALTGAHVYTASGTDTVKASIYDDGLASTTLTATVTVTDPSQTLSANTLSLTEGIASGTLTLGTLHAASTTAHASDFSVMIGWGDGSVTSNPSLVSTSLGNFLIEATHTYSDETPSAIPYPVIISVRDIADPTQPNLAVETSATVADASLTPTAQSISAWTSVATGSRIIAKLTDANPLATTADYTGTITWGDGGSSTAIFQVDAGGGFDIIGGHTYTSAGTFHPTVSILDDGGSSATVTSTISVSNPQVNIHATEGVSYSGVLATFSGGSPTSATINWGDGHSSAGTITTLGGGSYTVSGVNTYSEEGYDNVSITVSLSGGGTSTAFGVAQVADAALTASGVNVGWTLGQALVQVQVAHFTDADPGGAVGDYSATIDWGDGISTTGIVQANGGGGFDVFGTPPYVLAGGYTISTTIYDSGGAWTSVSSSATAGLIEGAVYALTLGVPAWSVGAGPSAEVSQVSISWGDGTSSAGQGQLQANSSGGSVVVSGQHVYSDEGLYSATATVTLSDGTTLTSSTPVTVVDAPLTAGSVSLEAVAGESTGLVQIGTFFDENISAGIGDFTASITWGDGTSVTTGTLVSLGNGEFGVEGNHSYAAVGTDTITITVTDAGGSSTTILGAAGVRSTWWLDTAASGIRTADPQRAERVTFGEATVDLNSGGLRLMQGFDFDLSPGTSVGRSPALVYNSSTVNQEILDLAVGTDPTGAAPTAATVTLTWDGTAQAAQTFTISWAAGEVHDLAVKVPSTATTGEHTWAVNATFALSGGGSKTLSGNGKADVVNAVSSAYGAGWSMLGIDTLFKSSLGVLWVDGNNDARYFSGSGTGQQTYTSPAEDFGTLIQGPGGTFTYTAHDQTEEDFSSAGLLTKVITEDGVSTSYTYDGSSRVSKVIASDGSTTTLNYNTTTGLLDTIVEPGSRTVSLTHVSTNITAIVDAAGFTRSLGYDTLHHVTSDSWAPISSTFGYDTLGLVTSVGQGSGTTYTISSAAEPGLEDSVGNATATVTDGLTHATTYVLDLRGRLLTKTQADGAVDSYVRNSAGQVVLYVNPIGEETNYTYVTGDLTRVNYADGSWEQTQYDRTFHQVIFTLNSAGQSSANTYDANTGDMLTSTDGLGAVTSYTWGTGSQAGLMLTQTSPTDQGTGVATNIYDSDRRLSVSYDAKGAPTYYTYDTSGNVSTTTDAKGAATATAFDGVNNLTLTTNADGSKNSSVYDAYGLATTITNELGYKTIETYDTRGLLTSEQTPTATTSTAYDAAENVSSSTDGDGNVWTYAYDADNRQTSETGPDGVVQSTMVYDKAGELLSQTDALKRKTSYTYDLLGRQVAMVDPRGIYSGTMYDLAGDQVGSLDGGVLTQTVYDKDGQATGVYGPNPENTFTSFDKAGNVSTQTDARGNKWSVVYDADNQQISSQDALGNIGYSKWDMVGNLVADVSARGYTTSYVYNAEHERIQTTDGSGVWSQSLFDPLGQTVASIDALGTMRNWFDGSGRQVRTSDGNGNITSWVLDGVGNATSTTDGNGNVTAFQFDAYNRQSLELDPGNRVMRSVFDADSEAVGAFDANNNVTQLGHDADGNTISTKRLDSGGAVLSAFTSTFNTANLETATKDALGNKTRTIFDQAKNVLQTIATDSAGTTITSSGSTYDKNNNVLTETDGAGNITSYTYDANNNVLTRVMLDAGSTTLDAMSYTYDKDNNVLTCTDAMGNVTSFTYDNADKRLTELMYDASGHLLSGLTNSYDLAADVTKTVDALSNTTSLTYDGAHNQLSQALYDSGSNLITSSGSAFDKDNNVTRSTDGAGNIISYTYDGNNEVVRETTLDAGSSTVGWTSYSYDAAGHVTLTNNGGSVTTADSYDGDNLTLSVVKDSGGTTLSYQSFTFDSGEEQTSASDGGKITTSNSYDGGLLTLSVVKDSLGATMGWTSDFYDQNERVTKEVQGGSITTSMGYDGDNLTLRVQTSASSTASYESWSYDLAGRATLTVDGASNSTSDSYDGDNLTLEVVKDSLGATVRSTSYAFDALGEKTLSIDGASHTISFVHSGGLLTGETWYGSGGTVSNVLGFTYDQNDELLTAFNNAGTYTFGYDGGNLVSEIDPYGVSLSFAYDSTGERTLTTDSQGNTTSLSFAGGVLVSETYQGLSTQLLVNFSHDVAGELVGISRYSDLAGTTLVGSTTETYEGGNLTSILHKDGGGTQIGSYGYTYNQADELTSEVINGATTAYGYDGAGQLTTAGTAGYSYDLNGNRTGAGISTGPDNQLTADGTLSYGYDGAGNMNSQSGVNGSLNWAYSYDSANELISATETNGSMTLVQANYTYDVFGNRIGLTVVQGGTTTTTQGTFDAVNPPRIGADLTNWALYTDSNGSGVAQVHYVRGEGTNQGMGQVVVGVGVRWTLGDHNNSVRVVTDSTGFVIDTVGYDAFGVISETTPSVGGRVKYDGYENDVWTGQFRAGQRYYLASAHRFISIDPYGLEADSNLYRYVKNAPTLATDPSGLVLFVGDKKEAEKVQEDLKSKYKLVSRVYRPLLGTAHYFIAATEEDAKMIYNDKSLRAALSSSGFHYRAIVDGDDVTYRPFQGGLGYDTTRRLALILKKSHEFEASKRPPPRRDTRAELDPRVITEVKGITQIDGIRQPIPEPRKFSRFQDLESALNGISPSAGGGLAKEIAAAIKNTFDKNSRTIYLPTFPGITDHRVKGYYCYDWAYAFQDAFNLYAPNNFFTAKVEGARIPGAEDVHLWLRIESVKTKRSIYIDDGFMYKNVFVHDKPPIRGLYKYDIHVPEDKPRKNASPPPAYDKNGKKR